MNTTFMNTAYFINLNYADNFNKYEKFVKYTSLEKQAQIFKLHFEIDAKLSLLSDLFVRCLAYKALNVKNDSLIIKKNNYGKPYFVEIQDFHFNISHTRNAVLIGISNDAIGVDVERITRYGQKKRHT